MPENLLNYRFSATKLANEELPIAGEHRHGQGHDPFGIRSEENWRQRTNEDRMATEEHLNLQCKQCTEEQEAKVDGTEKRVLPLRVYRDTATAAKAKKERIVVQKNNDPRPEARKEDTSEEMRENEGELHAWCLEESENEQWQEVPSKKSKLKMKRFAHESLLSVGNNSGASPKVSEVKHGLQDMSSQQRCSRK